MLSPSRQPSLINLFKISLMLFGIMAGFVFASAAQASCHSSAQAEPVVQAHSAMASSVMSSMVMNSLFSAGSLAYVVHQHGHECCQEQCGCPPMLCGGALGAGLPADLQLVPFGAEERVASAVDLYFLLPHTVHFKPPIQA